MWPPPGWWPGTVAPASATAREGYRSGRRPPKTASGGRLGSGLVLGQGDLDAAEERRRHVVEERPEGRDRRDQDDVDDRDEHREAEHPRHAEVVLDVERRGVVAARQRVGDRVVD